MSVGSRRTLGSPAVDLNFCVVATRLTHQPRPHEPPAFFPDLRRNLRPSARAPIFHRHTTSTEKAGDNLPVPTRIAPFAGQMCYSFTQHLGSPPTEAGGNSDGVESGTGRFTASDSTADGDPLNLDSSKAFGRTPGTASTKNRHHCGRMGSISAPMPPKLMDGPGKAFPKTVSVNYSSWSNNAVAPCAQASTTWLERGFHLIRCNRCQ